jgi:uncharacterized protein YvpB
LKGRTYWVVKVIFYYQQNSSFEKLQKVVGNNGAIVSVKLDETTRHAIIIDGFDGNYVLIRDPLPVGQGSSYKVAKEVFISKWSDLGRVIYTK